MDNRRNTYRVFLEEKELIPAELLCESGRIVPSQVTSLSLGGIGVRVSASGYSFAMQDRVQIRFRLPKAKLPLVFPMIVRRIEPVAEGSALGLQFQPCADVKEEEEREKQIWPFLLERQNKEIRRLRGIPKFRFR